MSGSRGRSRSFFFANPGRDANGEESIEDDFSVQVAGQ